MLYRYTATTAVVCMYEYVAVEYQNRAAQRNHPCTKQQTKYVSYMPIRVRIQR